MESESTELSCQEDSEPSTSIIQEHTSDVNLEEHVKKICPSHFSESVTKNDEKSRSETLEETFKFISGLDEKRSSLERLLKMSSEYCNRSEASGSNKEGDDAALPEFVGTRFLNEQSREIMSKIKDDLELACTRAETDTQKMYKALEELKVDLKIYRDTKMSLIHELCNLEKVKEQRLRQWMAENKNGSSVQLRLAQSALDYIALCRKDRHSKEKLEETEVRKKYLEISISIQRSVERAKVKYLDRLHRKFQQTNSKGDCFQRTSGSARLNSSDTEIASHVSAAAASAVVDVVPQWHATGLTLHRCQRVTDLHEFVNQDAAAEEEEDEEEDVVEDEVEKEVDAEVAKTAADAEDDGGDDGGQTKCCDLTARTASTSPLSHMESAGHIFKPGSLVAGQTTTASTSESTTALSKSTSQHRSGSSINIVEKTTSRHRN